MRNALAHLVCFLLGHDLGLYRLVCRNHFRLVCHWCHEPDADTLKDVCQRLSRRVLTLSEQGYFILI